MKHDPTVPPVEAAAELPAAPVVTAHDPVEPGSEIPNRAILFLCDLRGNWIGRNLRKLGDLVGNAILDIEVKEGLRALVDIWDDAWIPLLRAAGFQGVQLEDEKGVGIWAF